MPINFRFAFPITMFVIAGVSFGYGTYQYFSVRSARVVDEQRIAFIMETIEDSDFSDARKQELYTSIASGLPSSAPVFGIDFSGSLAAPEKGDQCVNNGQRALCRALTNQSVDFKTISSVCGFCNPK